MNIYRVIGLMSGSSLDGLDIVYAHICENGGIWTYEIMAADTFPLGEQWVARLKNMPAADAMELCKADVDLANYFGTLVREFVNLYHLEGQVDVIGSHGHTIFHFPSKGFTTQISNGQALAVATGLPVVSNFRVADVAAGGQGTPIVPIGDLLLFDKYRFCLNIGGIANVSAKTEKSIVAFDVCAANQLLNALANQLGKEYDENGELAGKGTICNSLLAELNSLAYFSAPYPKSLDNSFSSDVILPIINQYEISGEDKLSTVSEHIAYQIAMHTELVAYNQNKPLIETDEMLITGGGAFNGFLIQRIRQLLPIVCVVPSPEIVKYKEALVMALMAVRFMRNEVNVLSDVTGATKNTIGGTMHRP